MKLAGADTEEHREVRGVTGGLAFKLGNVADVLEFGFGLASICTGFTTQTAKDVTSFFFTADLYKPTG